MDRPLAHLVVQSRNPRERGRITSGPELATMHHVGDCVEGHSGMQFHGELIMAVACHQIPTHFRAVLCAWPYNRVVELIVHVGRGGSVDGFNYLVILGPFRSVSGPVQ